MAKRTSRSPSRRKTVQPGGPAAREQAPDALLQSLAPSAAGWLAVAGLEIVLSVLVSGTAARNDLLPFGARFAATGYGLAVLAAVTSALGAVLWLLGAIRRSIDSVPVRIAVRGAVLLVIWTAVLLYASSWALFWSTGVFLDRRAFAFLAAMNPVQVFHWVYPPLAIAVLIATTAFTFALARWIPRSIAQTPDAFQRRVVSAAAVSVVVCVIAAVFGGVTYGSGPGDATASKSDYDISRDDHAGPAAHALNEVRRSASASDLVTAGSSDSDKVIRRPIISMDQYVAAAAKSSSKRWNVVMVQVESLRSDQLRVYGGTRDVMPTLDALSRESRAFTSAYVQASHSNYEDLVPLSSHYPLRSPGMHEYPPNPTYPRVLIYDILKALGYKTAIFSSQNESWGGMVNYHRASSLDRFFDAETFSREGGPTYAPWGDMGFAEWVKETKGAGSVDDKYTMAEAIKWLDTVSGQPFFLHMNLQASHVPYVIPDDFPHRFSPKNLDFAIMWGKFPIDKIDVVKGRYADSLFYEDTQIARLFEYLKRRGLWEDTLIVIGGDNGEAFYEHNFASHASSLYNEVVKVPMIVKAPGLTPGLDDRPAMFLDVPPSILELLGLPPHPSFQGISLFQPQPNPDRSVYIIVQTPAAFQSAIVRSGFKLLYSEWESRYFLYDLVDDPAEKRNIASSRRDLVEQLGERLRFWRTEQLSYYADVARQSREYPPVVRD